MAICIKCVFSKSAEELGKCFCDHPDCPHPEELHNSLVDSYCAGYEKKKGEED